MGRLIPAHAGKTPPHDAAAPQARAHPRSRGENRGCMPAIRGAAGSSPLTRGKRPCAMTLVFGDRLIPAHAGKTSPPATAGCPQKAHPRSRGENLLDPIRIDAREGSSPLTRGKPHPTRHTLGTRRLIPAHAGKTSARPPRIPLNPAHPRSRGENLFIKSGSGANDGSSPLTRGKRWSRSFPWIRPRLIPAHAGKTREQIDRPAKNTAHPRSRGENFSVCPAPLPLDGSSPLTRGKPDKPNDLMPSVRLIPAHAGKTNQD